MDYKDAVGGMWDTIGKLQFDYLVEQGLKPEHRFLDMGCGSLRGGVHFVDYLDEGQYYGIDKQQWLLDAGRKLVDKEVNLECRDDFKAPWRLKFDYVLAQSLFTHLPLSQISKCLGEIAKVLKKRNGVFYATYFAGEEKTVLQDTGIRTYKNDDPYHYRWWEIEQVAEENGLRVTNMGDWDHPRSQQMARFEF